MSVNIGEHFERMVADMIESGRFQNQSEVMRAALRLLEEREYGYDHDLEAELLKRVESPAEPWKAADFDEIRKAGRAGIKRHSHKKAA